MPKVTLIYGSPSKKSTSAKILTYLDNRLKEAGVDTRWISVRDFPAEDLLHANFESAEIRQSVNWIEESDAVVIATPVYKASYTGLLKSYLDLLPQTALASKAVLPIAVGGSPAHLLVIDYALKPILYALGARAICGGVYGLDSQVTSHADESVSFEESFQRRLDSSVDEVLDLVQNKVTQTI
ncbi:NADPH-dependent FMN reductase [Alicyclobacillus acidiphilus]|uniref:NADPH-dependent FMN reductase n=1 Tax=Alicyclobacillus acidiphilus TaxID=182455 RepID=UPI0008342A7D|nr:NADPH-dependent FMN reductase [Alicyclobacillus acidiphilus]